MLGKCQLLFVILGLCLLLFFETKKTDNSKQYTREQIIMSSSDSPADIKLPFVEHEMLEKFDHLYSFQSAVEVKVDVYNPNWPCLFGAEPVFNYDPKFCSLEQNILDKHPGAQCNWKWMCGIRHLTDSKTVLYSFGSAGESLFEQGLSEILPKCEIHIFDPFTLPSTKVVKKWGFHTHSLGLGGRDEVWGKGTMKCGKKRPCFSDIQIHKFSTVMSMLDHDFIDFVKMDIEGSEEVALLEMNRTGFLSHIGMLNVELHSKVNVPMILRLLESAGFRWWKKEPTIGILEAAGAMHVSYEYAFIQKHWKPTRNSYGSPDEPQKSFF